MKSIKVAYQSTVRRFTVSESISWSELESKLRELFSLPTSFEFSLSYKDEEGDVITLSTDLELEEFLSQPPQSALKFTIVPERQQSLSDDIISSNALESSFISVEKENFTSDNVPVETDKHVTVMDSADEPSFNPTIFSTSKGKQKEEESPSTYETNEQEQEEQEEQEKQEQPSPNNNEQRAPFIDMAEQFQKLLDQFKDVLSNNPQLVEQANAIMDQILQNIPVDLNQLAQWLNTFRPEGEENTTTTNAQEGETNNPRGNGPGQFPPFLPSPHVLLSNPWIQRIAQDFSANYPRGFGNLENLASTGFNGSWNFNGGCPYQQQQQQQQKEGLSQEELKEKISILHSMGFWKDDVKNEELLKKYNGDIEKVIETLIEQQTEQNNNNSNNSTEGVVGDQ